MSLCDLTEEQIYQHFIDIAEIGMDNANAGKKWTPVFRAAYRAGLRDYIKVLKAHQNALGKDSGSETDDGAKTQDALTK